MSILQALIIFLPAGVANAAPVVANKIPVLSSWQTPLDFGSVYRGKRIFGANKTWRGVVFGTFIAAITGLIIQQLVSEPFWPAPGLGLIGAIIGFGALYGDAVESFFKRQRDVSEGKTWFPFDQLDYVVGGLLASVPLKLFTLPQMAAIVVVYFGLHLVFALIGYKLGLKKRPI